ncbi:MAG: CapA family protein [Myxococcota bacterium]
MADLVSRIRARLLVDPGGEGAPTQPDAGALTRAVALDALNQLRREPDPAVTETGLDDALAAFQARRGIPVTRSADPDTLRELSNALLEGQSRRLSQLTDAHIPTTAPALEPNHPSRTSVVLVGDTAFGATPGARALADRVARAGGSSFELFEPNVREILAGADATVANLESTILEDAGDHERWANKPFGTDNPNAERAYEEAYFFHGPPTALEATSDAWAGIDVVSLANNHIADFGESGMRETQRHLEALGFSYSGVGEGDAAYAPALYTTPEGERIAVFSFTTVYGEDELIESASTPSVARDGEIGVAVASPDRYDAITEVIARYEDRVDMAVVYMHWGFERDPLPRQEDIDLAHLMADAGADVIVGAHSHVLSGAELYRAQRGDGSEVAVPIFYGLSNFVFNPTRTGLLRIEADHDDDMIDHVAFRPAIIPNWGDEPRLAGWFGRRQIMDQLRANSAALETERDGAVSLFREAELSATHDGWFYFDLNRLRGD